MLKIIHIFIFIPILFNNLLFSQTLNWQHLYAPVASTVTGITRLSNGEFYLGTKTRGIFKSTDNGNLWIESFTGPSYIYINDIYSTDDNKLFACGGSGIFQFDWQTQEWVNLNAPQAEYVSIVVNSFGHIITCSNFGIFRSEDSGYTWQAATTNLLTGYSLVSTTNDILFAGDNYGVYKSIDNGDNWTKAGLDGFEITNIDIDNSDIVYANVFYRGQGIYRSQNQGTDWEQLNIGLADQLTTAVALDFQDNIYVGTSEGGVFQKTNGQSSFTRINMHQGMSNVLNIYVTQDNSLYICSELGGLFKRNEFSLEWEQLNAGLPLTQAIPLGFDSDDNFYMSNMYSGFYRSTDTGESWFPIAPYLGGSHLYTFLANDNQLYIGTTIEIAFVGALLRSTDQGENWDLYQEGIPEIDPNWPYIQPVLGMDANSNGDVFAALNTVGLYRRLMTDDRWYFLNSDIPDTNIFSICVNSNDIVFAGYSNGFIYKSDDNGDNWTESLPGVQDYTVELLKSAGNYVFAILHNWNYPHQDSSLGLYSYDNGDNWNSLKVDGLSSHVNSINYYDNNILVVGTDTNGVFISYDFGQNWISASIGLSDNFIKDIVMNPDGILLCGTENEGIFIANINPTNVDDINNTSMMFSLQQNYPNPFNPLTTIKYSIPSDKFVKLLIFNPIGEQITSLVNEYKTSGTYEVSLNAKDLPSGIYFYQLRTEGLVQTKKMILLK